jgi:uncharacterized protein involved in response to NO
MPHLRISNNAKQKEEQLVLLTLGFRPFFLGAGILALLSMILWLFVYSSWHTIDNTLLSVVQWHSHEMIFGFSLAVVAGFLLTAVANWTGVQTIRGTPLLVLFVLWAVPRLLFIFGDRFLLIAAVLDISFSLGLIAAIAAPIVRVRQWRQLGVLTKVSLLMLGNVCFYLGAFRVLAHGTYWGIYGGVYLLTALVLTIGGRVLPGFISNGVDEDVNIPVCASLGIASLGFFLVFFVNELFLGQAWVTGASAMALFAVNTCRLISWHTWGIWRKPLLWGLYLSFVFIDVGFLLFAVSSFGSISPLLPVHAFTVGGIGLATLSMMSRVTLGHTGRSIHTPASLTSISLRLMAIGAVIRVFLPLVDPGRYSWWIFLSQTAWIAAFGAFLFAYSHMLVGPRADTSAV